MENNIKIDFQKVGREVVDWIDLSQDREKQPDFAKTAINVHLP
jgi:hypothetical protein